MHKFVFKSAKLNLEAEDAYADTINNWYNVQRIITLDKVTLHDDFLIFPAGYYHRGDIMLGGRQLFLADKEDSGSGTKFATTDDIDLVELMMWWKTLRSEEELTLPVYDPITGK